MGRLTSCVIYLRSAILVSGAFLIASEYSITVMVHVCISSIFSLLILPLEALINIPGFKDTILILFDVSYQFTIAMPYLHQI